MAKILFLTSGLPWPLEMHGGAQRTQLLLEALEAVAEVNIAFVSWSLDAVEQARQAQADDRRIVGVFHAPYETPARIGGLAGIPIIGKPFRTARTYLSRYQPEPRFADWLGDTIRAGTYDGVVSRFLWPGARGALRRARGVRTFLDWDDLDHLKTRSQIVQTPWKGVRGALASRIMLRALEKFCLAEAASYDHVWVAKPGDLAEFAARSASVLPNIPFDDDMVEPDASQRRDVLFIGNQTYLPNAEALTGFLDQAWPRVRRECPTARLWAVGPPPVPEVAARWQAAGGVEVVGAVDSLTPFYGRAAVSICPIQWGGGSNIKAIESLGYGIPCVASPYSYDAFCADLDADSGLICARSPDDYARACIDLITHPDRSLALGAAGRAIVAARYSRARFREVIRAGLAQAGILPR